MASILVIDDSAYMRSKISAALKADSHSVTEASDGNKGLHLVYAHKPDCVILDLIMPEIDGLKILKVLHDEGSKIPVIVITADIQESVRRQSMEYGAAAFINKPPKEEELRTTVRKVLDRNKERR